MARGAELRGAGHVVSRVMVMVTVGTRGGVGCEGRVEDGRRRFRCDVRTHRLVEPKDAKCSCTTAIIIDAHESQRRELHGIVVQGFQI